MRFVFATVAAVAGSIARPGRGATQHRHAGAAGPTSGSSAAHGLRAVRRPLAMLCAILVAANLLGPAVAVEPRANPSLCHGATPDGGHPAGHTAPWVQHCCFAAALALAPPAAPMRLWRAPCAEGRLPAFVGRPLAHIAASATRIRAPPA